MQRRAAQGVVGSTAKAAQHRKTPLPLPTLRDRADFASCFVVASSLGVDPTSSAPPRLKRKSATVAGHV